MNEEQFSELMELLSEFGMVVGACLGWISGSLLCLMVCAIRRWPVRQSPVREWE